MYSSKLKHKFNSPLQIPVLFKLKYAKHGKEGGQKALRVPVGKKEKHLSSCWTCGARSKLYFMNKVSLWGS